MATELRHIILSKSEFTSSLHSFRRTHEDFLPSGDIVDWKAGDNGTIDVTLCIKGGSTTYEMAFTIEPEQITDIIVRFCMENNIPVPRAGDKKWSSREDGVMLSMALKGSELDRANIDMAALA